MMDFIYELNQIILRELGDAIVNRRKKLGLMRKPDRKSVV